VAKDGPGDHTETWHRLARWLHGPAAAERLAAQILEAEGYSVNPHHPHGGRDGGADGIAERDGVKWVMAVYFPTDQVPENRLLNKIRDDWRGVALNGAHGMLFVTNQKMTRSVQKTAQDAVGGGPLVIYHLDRMVHLLELPSMADVRGRYVLPPEVERPTRKRRVVIMAAASTTGTLAALLASNVIKVPAPSVADQITRIRADLIRRGFQLKVQSAKLHPDGNPSTLVIAKPTDGTRARDPHAHEHLLIYDQDASGRLKVKFVFEPIADMKTDAGPLPGSARPENFTFDCVQVMDVDEADGAEILGAVTELGNEQDVFPRPFVIAWDVTARRYVLQALLSPKSTTFNTMEGTVRRPSGRPLEYAPLLYQNVYVRPTALRNGEGEGAQALKAYAVHVYVLKKLEPDRSTEGFAGRLRLRAAYALSGRSAGTLEKIQVIDWTLIMRPNGGDVTAYAVQRGSVDVGVNSSRLKSLLEELQ
jgi:hypothetical protein